MFFVHPSKLLRSSTLRLSLIYMALFSVSVLILLAFIYWSTARYMSQQTDATIEAEIAGLAARYRITGLAGLTGLIAKRLARKPAGSTIYLLADRYYDPVIGNLDRWPEVPADSDGWISFLLEDSSSDGEKVHRARARRFELRGGFYLLVGRDMQELEEVRRSIVQALIWGVVITVFLAMVGGTMMTRSMMHRIEAITATSREIVSGDLSRRIPTRNTGDDFDRLTENLNAMLDQIELLMESVRRVSDNIAHDLKTPLARLRNRLELVKLQLTENHLSTTSVDAAVAQADELLSTFNALLRIARIESKRRREGFARLDLGTLIRDVVELYEPLAEEKQQCLEITSTTEVYIQGDRDLVFQAFANLLDNAIKYTPDKGSIRVVLRHAPDQVSVTITDNGPGIPLSERGNVFQRFYRLEDSRTTSGNGLGLSLVAAVAKLHGINIVLEDNHPGLRVVLEFPEFSADVVQSVPTP